MWSANGFNVAWFLRRDYLGNRRIPLDQAVRDLVERKLGEKIEMTAPVGQQAAGER